MLGTLQKTNINRQFDILDITHDGFISEDDFQTLARNVRGLRDDLDPKTAAKIDKAFADWWKHFQRVADSDGDGKVTREEFLAAIEHGMDQDRDYVDQMVIVPRIIFQTADTDGTGELTHAQMARVYKAIGINAKFSKEMFDRIDLDGNGRISLDEFLQTARDVYLNNDPNAASAVAYGPVP
ncbi:EF-hand domain-containing protein [Kitasatospora sp. NPDC057542]|uniref:EF-hand domain-containing protein n=1 Tax=Kitasatospora sp. NPDC057542 TaxID=3346162 RepID=UPI003675265E